MNREELKTILDREIEAECKKRGKIMNSPGAREGFNLFGSGIFDSLGILKLINRLEEETGIEVDLSEYSPSEFTDYSKLLEIFTER